MVCDTAWGHLSAYLSSPGDAVMDHTLHYITLHYICITFICWHAPCAAKHQMPLYLTLSIQYWKYSPECDEQNIRWLKINSFFIFSFLLFSQYVTELWRQREAGSWIILTVCFRFLADSHNGTNGWWKIMELWGALGNIGMAGPGLGRPPLSNRFWHARVKFKVNPPLPLWPLIEVKTCSSSVCVLIFLFHRAVNILKHVFRSGDAISEHYKI